MLKHCITDVPGIRVGHAVSTVGHTGCTVILVERGAIAGLDIGGSAPGMRETEMLNPTNMVMRIHAVLLTGGSTFGLNAAGGVQQFLQERDIGFTASTGVIVPIVPTAVIFDLDVGKPRIYPDRDMGLAASEGATEDASPEGRVGAGIGATVGKVLGSDSAMRGGLGTASVRLANGVTVGALAVCNAWGDVVDPRTGQILAGARQPDDPERFLDTESYIFGQTELATRYFGMDTTLCVVATDGAFTREQITKIAMMAQDGIPRVVRPSHTMFDGDVVFALSTLGRPTQAVDVNIVGSVAARLVETAIVRGVSIANELPVPEDF
ncbi:MAG TPA: P1 family peptidase [Vicinamibacteria bacterium]|nr:P1 family peptidase [Vicinamibacteria bacterium]